MSGPLHTLKHEHRVIEMVLRALDGVCARLEWGEHVPAEALARLVDFVSQYADAFHHLKEETYLFPALERQGVARHGGPLGLIELEHERERELTAKMLVAIEGYKEVDPHARQDFVDAARRYSDLLVPHIQNEDSILFRIADELLDEAELRFLAEAFRLAEAEPGEGKIAAYERAAAELEDRWAV